MEDLVRWRHARGLARGRTYAHAGCVHDLEIVAGTVSARVTGSRPTRVVSASTAGSGKTVRANLSAFDRY